MDLKEALPKGQFHINGSLLVLMDIKNKGPYRGD